LSSVLHEYLRLETHFGNSGWPACLNQVSELQVSATIFLSLQEARAFNHFKNKIRGSSLFINNNEARAFHFSNNKIRESSLFVTQASSFIIITMNYNTAIYLEENL
jgi:hypothetical protein